MPNFLYALILKKFGIESRQKEGEREQVHVSAEL